MPAAGDIKTQVVVSLDDKLTEPIEKMLKVLKKLAKSTKELTDMFSGAGAAMGDFQVKSEQAAQQSAETAETVKALAKSGAKLETSVDNINRSMGKAAHAFGDGRDTLKRMERALEECLQSNKRLERQMTDLNDACRTGTKELSDLNTNLRQMAEDQRKAAEETRRQAKAQQEAADADKQRAETLKSLQDVGGMMQGLGVTLMAPAAAAAKAGYDAINAYQYVEAARVRLQNTFLKGEDPTEKLGQAVTAAEKLGVSLPGSTEDMLNMFSALREQGVAMEIILNGMGEATANFATMFGTGFEESAVMMSKFREALGVTAEDTPKLVDELQRLRGVSGLTTDELYQTFKYLGPSLKTLNIEGINATKDISTVLALMANTGLEGSQAGTGLAAALSRMANLENKTERKAFQKAVGAAFGKNDIKLEFFDSKGSFIGIQGMVKELTKLKKLSNKELSQALTVMFGEEAARPMAALVNAGTDEFYKMQQRQRSQLDTQTKITSIMGQLSMKWETLQGTASTTLAKVGERLSKLADLSRLIDKANDMLGKFNDWIDKNPGKFERLLKMFAGMAAAAGVIGSALTTAGTALVAGVTVVEKLQGLKTAFEAVAKLKNVASAVTKLQKAWAVVEGAGSAAIAEIAAIGYFLFVLVRDWIGWLRGLWKAFKIAWSQMTPELDYTKLAWKQMVDAVKPAIDAILKAVGALDDWLDVSGDLETLAKDVMVPIFKTDIALIAACITAIASLVQSIFEFIAWAQRWRNYIVAYVEQAWSKIKAQFKEALGHIMNLRSSFFEAGRNVIGGLTDGLKERFPFLQTVADTVKSILPETRAAVSAPAALPHQLQQRGSVDQSRTTNNNITVHVNGSADAAKTGQIVGNKVAARLSYGAMC